MSNSEGLGSRHEVRLSAGTIAYRERGDGAPIVFVHPVFTNGDHWREVVPTLAERYRCITPDWPLGSHSAPMHAGADLSPPGRLPITYGWVSHLPLDRAAGDSYVRPLIRSRGTRRDANKVLRGMHPRHTLAASERFTAFDRPVLVVWGEDDRIFPRSLGERLAYAFPRARFTVVAGSRTFVPEDRPAQLAGLIRDFTSGVDQIVPPVTARA
jgi:pimeloyl-ACP methyl ester carboxylesterase